MDDYGSKDTDSVKVTIKAPESKPQDEQFRVEIVLIPAVLAIILILALFLLYKPKKEGAPEPDQDLEDEEE